MDMNSVDSSVSSVQEIREAILHRFETWLDSALTEDPPLSDLAADLLTSIENGTPLPPVEGRCDLYTLWSAMTALTQEVKLQSRTFKQVNDTLAQLPEAVATAMGQDSSPEPMDEEEATAEEKEPEAVSATAPERRPEKPYIDLLLDLRDRLDRGLSSVREASAGLIIALAAPSGRVGTDEKQQSQTQEILTALEKGYTLILDRLEQALQDYHLNPILCEGKEFDSHRMTAVELEETDLVPEGTVLGVYRAGYEWEGEVYRAAQVKVARRKLSCQEL
jgi:molecular chaperone GrpE